MLETTATWDRGLGVLRTATDPNGAVSTVEYDGLGRMTVVRRPNIDGCESSTVPTQHFDYELVPGGIPVSVVTATSEFDCTAVGTDTLVTKSYVDGLGRTRATLTDAEDNQWEHAGA